MIIAKGNRIREAVSPWHRVKRSDQGEVKQAFLQTLNPHKRDQKGACAEPLEVSKITVKVILAPKTKVAWF